jgi:hypothetical protein
VSQNSKPNKILFAILFSALIGCQSTASKKPESSTVHANENRALILQSIFEPSGSMLLEPLNAGTCLYKDKNIKVSCYSNNTFTAINVHFNNQQNYAIDSPEGKQAYRTILNADIHQSLIEKLIAKNPVKKNYGQYFHFTSHDRDCQVQPFSVWDKNYNSSLVSVVFAYTCSSDTNTQVRLFELKQKIALALYKDQVDPSTITMPENK